MAASMAPGDARWRRTRTYPLWGLLLAAGAPIGYLVFRVVLSTEPRSLGWIARERGSSAALYALPTVSTAVIFAGLGALLGWKEDTLEQSSATDPLTGL